MPVALATVKPAAVLELDEDDYMFGEGRLKIRIVQVGGFISAHGAAWRHVTAIEIRWNGVEDRNQRDVYIRIG